MIRRLLPLAACAAAVFVPAAIAAPGAPQTVRGTVVGKDRAHHALVLALPSGSVRAIVVPGLLARVAIGRNVVLRATPVSGRLATDSRMTVNGTARKALVRGTIVRLATRRAVLNAGGIVLAVRLAPTRPVRSIASSRSGPQVGDVVVADVEIDDDGSLNADRVVVTSASAASAGVMEVRGKVTVLVPATAVAPGAITVDVMGLAVSCVIPAGAATNVKLGTMIELACNAIGDPAVWTVRGGHDEDEQATDESDSDNGGASGEDDDQNDVHGDSTEGDDDQGSDD